MIFRRDCSCWKTLHSECSDFTNQKHCSDIQKFIGADSATHKITWDPKGKIQNVANPESSTQFESTLSKNFLELRRLATKKAWFACVPVFFLRKPVTGGIGHSNPLVKSHVFAAWKPLRATRPASRSKPRHLRTPWLRIVGGHHLNHLQKILGLKIKRLWKMFNPYIPLQ